MAASTGFEKTIVERSRAQKMQTRKRVICLITTVNLPETCQQIKGILAVFVDRFQFPLLGGARGGLAVCPRE